MASNWNWWSSQTMRTSDWATIRVDRGSDWSISMTVLNWWNSWYSSWTTFSWNKWTWEITQTNSDWSRRTWTVSWMQWNNPKGSSISWWDYSYWDNTPNFGNMKFGQGTSDIDQKNRNAQLTDWYANQWNYSYESIFNDLMQNEWFKNASAADQKATVQKILNAANAKTGWTSWMKFGQEVYNDSSYDMDARNNQLKDIATSRWYTDYGSISNWLENSSESFKNASATDKDLTIKKILNLQKWIDSATEWPTDEQIAEESKSDDETNDNPEEWMEGWEEKYNELVEQIKQMNEERDADRDYREQYYREKYANKNNDTLNLEEEKTPEVSLNNLSYAYNQQDVWDWRPEQVDPASTATPYLTPDKNVKQDIANPWDNTVQTNVWLIQDNQTPKFSVYNVDTAEWIINAANDAFTNIMNWQYGWDTWQMAVQAYMLAENRLKNYCNLNGIKEWSPEYTNLFRQFLNHPIWNNLVTNWLFEWQNEEPSPDEPTTE